MARRSVFILLFVCLLAASLGAQTGPWWVIGHMSNTPDAVHWAASVGANGIEADLLSCALDVRPTSRLTCQIPVTDALDGIIVRLPEVQA